MRGEAADVSEFYLAGLKGFSERLLALGNDVTIGVRPTNDDCAPCDIKLAL
jgi:hypothetical protein